MRISGWRIHTASKRTLAAARNGPICDGQQQHSRRQTQTDAYPAFTNVAVRALGIRKRRAIQVILSIARVFLSLDDRSANAGSEGERIIRLPVSFARANGKVLEKRRFRLEDGALREEAVL